MYKNKEFFKKCARCEVHQRQKPVFRDKIELPFEPVCEFPRVKQARKQACTGTKQEQQGPRSRNEQTQWRRKKIYLICETLNELRLSSESRRLQLVLSNIGDGSNNSLAELRLQKDPKYASWCFLHCLTVVHTASARNVSSFLPYWDSGNKPPQTPSTGSKRLLSPQKMQSGVQYASRIDAHLLLSSSLRHIVVLIRAIIMSGDLNVIHKLRGSTLQPPQQVLENTRITSDAQASVTAETKLFFGLR